MQTTVIFQIVSNLMILDARLATAATISLHKGTARRLTKGVYAIRGDHASTASRTTNSKGEFARLTGVSNTSETFAKSAMNIMNKQRKVDVISKIAMTGLMENA